MLISVHSFGSIWSCRRRDGKAAFFNTTGVAVGTTLRHRSCTYGHVRINGCTGFEPERARAFLNRALLAEPPCERNGVLKLFVRGIATAGCQPDRYLIAARSQVIGCIDRNAAWKCADADVISFSDGNDQQEALVLVPAFGWITGSAGTLCVVPKHGRPCQAELEWLSPDGALMRYPKGSIGVGEAQDYPLLREVMDSQFITHSQLWHFLSYHAHETSRSSFCWRVKRLADNGFVKRHRFPMVDRDLIYSLSAAGVTYVQNHGALYSGPAAGPTVTPDGAGVAHAIGLNSIRLELVRAGCVTLWQSEVEIRSHNELAKQPYAKDYDAIVTLQLGGRSGMFGIEFERTPKSRTDYIAIRRAIESETQLR